MICNRCVVDTGRVPYDTQMFSIFFRIYTSLCPRSIQTPSSNHLLYRAFHEYILSCLRQRSSSYVEQMTIIISKSIYLIRPPVSL